MSFEEAFNDQKEKLRKLKELISVVRELVELKLTDAANDGLSKELAREILELFDETEFTVDLPFNQLKLVVRKPTKTWLPVDLKEYKEPEEIADVILSFLLEQIYRPSLLGKDVRRKKKS